MFLVVGLGNIGKEYEETRHNIGFKVVDKLAEMYKIQLDRKRFKGMCSDFRINGEKVVVVKPQTYMNSSGECVIEFANYFDIPDENIIVVYDDISLDVGRIRIRKKGSSGGQNGIKSIISHLDSDKFPRIKVGVGKPAHDWISHVMGRFSGDDEKVMDRVIEEAGKSIICIIEEGTDKAMNVFNSFNGKEE